MHTSMHMSAQSSNREHTIHMGTTGSPYTDMYKQLVDVYLRRKHTIITTVANTYTEHTD